MNTKTSDDPQRGKPIVKRAVFLFFILVLVLTPALGLASGPVNAPPPPGNYRAGVVLVKLKSLVDHKGAAQVLAADGLVVLEEIPILDVQVVTVSPGQEMATAERLKQNPLVEYAEPDYIVYGFGTANDEYYSEQWNLTRIQADEAWDITTGGEDITIAIVDTGVDLAHPDLAAKIVPGWDFVNDDDDPQDDHGHGTQVSGVAAATSNNSIGIAGVSWGAKIMPVKVLNDANWGTVSNVAAGITYAADNGADIINLSLGKRLLPDPDTLKQAVDYAQGKGCLLVAAANDDGSSTAVYPAGYPNVLAVGATDYSDQRMDSSGHGSYLDVVAPGQEIPVTNLGSAYSLSDGTSVATPHAAGLAALIWSVRPSYTVTDVMNIIEWTSEDITDPPAGPGWDEYTGWGRINARRALAGIIGYVRDNEGNAVGGATVAAHGPAVGSTTAQSDGFFRYASALPGTYSVTASNPGFDSLPAMHGVPMITGTDTLTLTFVLPPEINGVQNWDFEDSTEFANWNISGTITPVITSAAHTGLKAALLGQDSPPTGGDSLITQTVNLTTTLQFPRLSFAYTLSSTDTITNDRFQVWATDGVSTTTVLSTCTPVDWTYVFYDLSAYTSTITLTFQVAQTSDAYPTTAVVDEVSVGLTEVSLGPSMRLIYLPVVFNDY
jgi:subtilisin family serine protease